jgi:hypothetical protein
MKSITYLKIKTDFNSKLYISSSDEDIQLIKLKINKLTDMYEGYVYFEYKSHNYNQYIKNRIEEDDKDEWTIKYDYYDINNNCIVDYKPININTNTEHKWTKLWVHKNTNKITNINPFEKPLNIDNQKITIYIEDDKIHKLKHTLNEYNSMVILQIHNMYDEKEDVYYYKLYEIK